MNIHIPSDVATRLRERAKNCGFDSIEQFVMCLVEAELQCDTPLKLSASEQQRLGELVDEGIRSGFEPLTPADFQGIRDRLVQRINESEGDRS
ncbi:hypothetical protein AB1K70_16275 [Bremerella sp. JC770]|uniref:hypothetical protein n=1 Tax=Bremerella sp. JC770 TaxID=3232137 RepID=UPI00345867FD